MVKNVDELEDQQIEFNSSEEGIKKVQIPQNLVQRVFSARRSHRPSLLALYQIESAFGNIQKDRIREIFADDIEEKHWRQRLSKYYNDENKEKSIKNYIKSRFKDYEEGIVEVCTMHSLFEPLENDDPTFVQEIEEYCWATKLLDLGVYALVNVQKEFYLDKKISYFPAVTANFVASKTRGITYNTVESALAYLADPSHQKLIDIPLTNVTNIKIGKKNYSLFKLTEEGKAVCQVLKDKKTKYGRISALEEEIEDAIFKLKILYKNLKKRPSCYKSTVIIRGLLESESNKQILKEFDTKVKELLPKDSKLRNTLIEALNKSDEGIDEFKKELGRIKVNKYPKNLERIDKLVERRKKVEEIRDIYASLEQIVTITLNEVEIAEADFQYLLDKVKHLGDSLHSVKIETSKISELETDFTGKVDSKGKWLTFSDTAALDWVITQNHSGDEINKYKEEIRGHDSLRIDLELAFNRISTFVREFTE